MTTERRWRITWDVWLSVVAGSFALLECRALRSHGESATLTVHLRRTLGLHPRRRMCWAGQGLIAGVLGWLIIHLLGGVWPSDGWIERWERRQ